jgi:hypothetical protein
MEPTLTDPTDDPLETLLRAAPPAIPDDGFTSRVCAALPSRESAVPRFVRWAVLAGAALLGCALTVRILSLADLSLAQTIFDAVRGWRFELWQALLIFVVASIWGTIAVTRDEWEGGTPTRR